MMAQVEHRVDLGDGHTLWAIGDLHDLVSGFHLSFLQHAQVKARFLMCDEQRSHLRVVHADADPVAGDTRLRDLKEGAADAVLVADAHLLVGQALDGKILPELSEHEVVSAELAFPIVIRIHLVDEDCPLLPSVPGQVCLLVTIDVEPPHHPSALHGLLPYGGAHRLPSPGDVAGQTNIH
jgi:hypothetical protein